MIVTQITIFLILQGNKIIQHEKCQFLCKSSHLQVYLSRKNPAISSSSSPIKIQELNNIEENALRYVAGYICHKIVSNLSRSQHPHKLMLLLFM